MNRALSLLLLAGMFQGCISSRSGGPTGEERVWTEGETARRDIVGAWGNPDSIRDNVWTWRENRGLGGKIKASYYNIGVSISNIDAHHREHRLVFDDDGILVSHEIFHSVAQDVSWSIFPW